MGRNPMSIELDHIFLLTAVGAPIADLVAAEGLTEGSSNIHPGQGTSNRRFFFENTTLKRTALLMMKPPLSTN